MRHVDQDVLALLALGESVATPAELTHLASCADCTADLTELGSAARIARTAVDVPLLVPDERVWVAIAARLGLPGGDARGTAMPDRRVVGLRRWSHRRRTVLVLAAVAAVAAVAIGGFAVMRPAPRTIARAQLVASAAWAGASGTATVQRLPDGVRVVHVTVRVTDASPGTFHEAWLGTADAKTMVPLGVLHDGTGTFTVPRGVSLATYPVVDVSDEPRDGVATNSGDSIVRGALEG